MREERGKGCGRGRRRKEMTNAQRRRNERESEEEEDAGEGGRRKRCQGRGREWTRGRCVRRKEGRKEEDEAESERGAKGKGRTRIKGGRGKAQWPRGEHRASDTSCNVAIDIPRNICLHYHSYRRQSTVFLLLTIIFKLLILHRIISIIIHILDTLPYKSSLVSPRENHHEVMTS